MLDFGGITSSLWLKIIGRIPPQKNTMDLYVYQTQLILWHLSCHPKLDNPTLPDIFCLDLLEQKFNLESCTTMPEISGFWGSV